MKEFILPTVIAILGSGAFFSFLQFIITRHDIRKGWTAQNVDRLQLMVLIADYPRKVDEILKLAEHYFVELKGNSFLKELFADWLKSQNIQEPEWFELIKHQ
jgi:hypothetical protein